MKSLHVQNYLRSGKSLNDLYQEHGVKYYVQNGKISLSYDQIEAKESDVLSQQCRGLILREDNYNIVACPMFRFFNLEQKTVDNALDWESAKFEEKLDGTLIIVYYDDNAQQWYCATRSRPEADVPVDNGVKTFTDIVNLTVQRQFKKESFRDIWNLANPSFRKKTFCLELCSPLNRIVCYYPEFELTLLSVRDNDSFLEEDTKSYSLALGIPSIKTYAFNKIADMIEFVKQCDPREHEGIVAKDNNFNRIKIKNPAYIAFNHIKNKLTTSVRGCFEIVLLGKDDDIINMIPDFIADRIRKIKPLIAEVLSKTHEDYEEIKNLEPMKEFALAAGQKLWPSALFALKRGRASDLLLFAQGNDAEVAKIPKSSIDVMIELCYKLDPSIKDL